MIMVQRETCRDTCTQREKTTPLERDQYLHVTDEMPFNSMAEDKRMHAVCQTTDGVMLKSMDQPYYLQLLDESNEQELKIEITEKLNMGRDYLQLVGETGYDTVHKNEIELWAEPEYLKVVN